MLDALAASAAWYGVDGGAAAAAAASDAFVVGVAVCMLFYMMYLLINHSKQLARGR